MAHAIVITNHIIEVKTYCLHLEQLGINSLHYRISGTTGGPVYDDEAAVACDLLINPLYLPLLNANAQWKGLTFQIVGGGTPQPYQVSATHSNFGTVAGDLMSRQTCGIITKLTAGIGRANRGRVYFPFPGEADNQVTATPVAGYVTRLTNLANVILVPFNIAGASGGTITMQPIIFHRLSGLSTDINGFRSNQKWATQRRRGSYGRPNTLPTGF